AQSSLPIARAILCHRCHLSAGIETASCARSTPIGVTLHCERAYWPRCGCANGAYALTVCHAPPTLARFIASFTFRQEWDEGRSSLYLAGLDDGSERTLINGSIDWTSAGGTASLARVAIRQGFSRCSTRGYRSSSPAARRSK